MCLFVCPRPRNSVARLRALEAPTRAAAARRAVSQQKLALVRKSASSIQQARLERAQIIARQCAWRGPDKSPRSYCAVASPVRWLLNKFRGPLGHRRALRSRLSEIVFARAPVYLLQTADCRRRPRPVIRNYHLAPSASRRPRELACRRPTRTRPTSSGRPEAGLIWARFVATSAARTIWPLALGSAPQRTFLGGGPLKLK